jgi:hypothetical protein
MSSTYGTWIDIETAGGNTSIVDHGALYRLGREMPRLDVERPSLVLFWGTTGKNATLAQSFCQGKFPPNRPNGKITQGVKIYSSSRTSENRLLLVACPDTEPAEGWSGDAVSKNVCKRYLLNWRTATSTKEVEREIYQKLLLPFSDVVCFVAENLANTIHIAKEILSWADFSNGTSFVGQARPLALIICTQEIEQRFFDPHAASEYFHKLLNTIRLQMNAGGALGDDKDVSRIFSHINFACMSSSKPEATEQQFRELEGLLQQGANTARRSNSSFCTLFSI